MSVCVWWSLVPIALVSCCSNSFRSSTEEMGEFLTRSTSDVGSGSPCTKTHRQEIVVRYANKDLDVRLF